MTYGSSLARGGRGLAGLLVALALVACGGGGGGGGNGGANPSAPTAQELEFLRQHNARFNDGLTTRWRNLPIRVFTNNIAQQDEVTEWTQATGGAVTFTFVGRGAGADITFRFGTGNDICGVTTVEFNENGDILTADVRVVQAIFRTSACQRTVTHEVGHAIGFLDHTSDGGLMDDDGGDGRITEPVAGMFRLLYSLEPGTPVGVALGRRTLRRSANGRYVLTIVYPVRR
jgi:hypothetical protein